MKVIAIHSFKKGIMKTYGKGEYIGDLIPNSGVFGEMNIKNPCIKLDSGKYVWGYECWWGAVKKMQEKFDKAIKETIIVEPDNIQPKTIKNEQKDTTD